MIQDIAPHIYHNEYRPVPPDADSILFYFEGDQVLAGAKGEGLSFPRFQDLPAIEPELSSRLLYLFSIDQQTFYLAEERPDFESDQFQMKDTRMFRSSQPEWLCFAGITAYQLFRWYHNRRFCGHCGRPLVHSLEERMLYCPNCGVMEYPKICPAVIVGIIHGDRLLMSKYANRSNTPYYALIAGFAEIGETIEETVRREVYEETGLHVKNLRYYKSQPWSFSDTLLFGFFAELDGDDESITLDTRELAAASWFTREEAPAQPLNISLTSEMIWKFKNGEI